MVSATTSFSKYRERSGRELLQPDQVASPPPAHNTMLEVSTHSDFVVGRSDSTAKALHAIVCVV